VCVILIALLAYLENGRLGRITVCRKVSYKMVNNGMDTLKMLKACSEEETESFEVVFQALKWCDLC
jgi:hypothetical protein